MIRIGIVGCGRILAAHLRGYRLLRQAGVDDFRITALCSRRPEDAASYVKRGAGPAQRTAVSELAGDPLSIGDEYLSDFQPETPVAIFDDYREMIAKAPIDAVNDFSTHAMHHEVALAAFAAGKAALSQKPLSITVAAGRRVCEEAARKGIPLGVFENFRHEATTKQLRWLFASGRIGKPTLFLVGYIGAWWAPDLIVANTPWRHQKALGGGVTLDLAVHFLDQMRAIAGEPRDVAARVSRLVPLRRERDATGRVVREIEVDADDTFFADFSFESGAIASLAASWAGAGGATTFGSGTIFYGEKGRVDRDRVTFDQGSVESLESLYLTHAPPELKDVDFPHGLTDSFALNQLDWLDGVRAGKQPVTNGEQGLRDLAAAYAILEADHASRRIAVADVLEGRVREFQRFLDRQHGFA